jgi:hypothetical protein
MSGYKILAHSASLNETQREIELNGNVITDQRLAQQRADAFAGILNRDRKGHATDWVGKIEYNPHAAPNTI